MVLSLALNKRRVSIHQRHRMASRAVIACVWPPSCTNGVPPIYHVTRAAGRAGQGRAAPKGFSRDAAAGYHSTLPFVGNMRADLFQRRAPRRKLWGRCMCRTDGEKLMIGTNDDPAT